jgi:hypothetical protein
LINNYESKVAGKFFGHGSAKALYHNLLFCHRVVYCYTFPPNDSPEIFNFPYSAGSRIVGIGDTIEKNLDGQ